MEIAPRQQHSRDSACSKDRFERKCETLNSDFVCVCERGNLVLAITCAAPPPPQPSKPLSESSCLRTVLLEECKAALLMCPYTEELTHPGGLWRGLVLKKCT